MTRIIVKIKTLEELENANFSQKSPSQPVDSKAGPVCLLLLSNPFSHLNEKYFSSDHT